ncbi:hypothetical protein HanRHA438_Chr06g0270451 [Helianthus annuus]|nr:hypothetical protein HanIR_Chr06g0280881 [Helianthus annuus]KAJ0912097.1 hypothetical protein HanRHA438_Chr06g0270451 [Helianthus annuus]
MPCTVLLLQLSYSVQRLQQVDAVQFLQTWLIRRGPKLMTLRWWRLGRRCIPILLVEGKGAYGSVCNNILRNSVVRTTAAPLTPYLQGFGLYAWTVRSSRVTTNLWRIYHRILARRTSRRLPSSTTTTKKDIISNTSHSGKRLGFGDPG